MISDGYHFIITIFRWDPDQWVWAGMRKVRNNLAVDTNKQYKASVSSYIFARLVQ